MHEDRARDDSHDTGLEMEYSTEEHKKALLAAKDGLKLIDLLERSRKVHEFYKSQGWIWTPFEQIAHCHAEISEIWDMLRNKNNKYGDTLSEEWKRGFLEECSDGIITILTVCYLLSCNDSEILDAFERTVIKLENRVKDSISIYRQKTSV